MNLFSSTAFLSEGFENGKIQRFYTSDYMTWGSISLFGGFLEKENPLETIVIFENVSPKGFSWLKMKYFEFQFWRQILDIYRQPLLKHAVDQLGRAHLGRPSIWVTGPIGRVYNECKLFNEHKINQKIN